MNMEEDQSLQNYEVKSGRVQLESKDFVGS